jgi:hypothetical protein
MKSQPFSNPVFHSAGRGSLARTAEFGNLLSMGHLRKSFASLMNITDNEWGIYTHKHLVDLCKKLRIPLRKNLGDWGHSS